MIAVAEGLHKLNTEQQNVRSAHIDTLTTLETVALINDEDHLCAEAVKAVLPEVARSVDAIYEKMRSGGRLFYCGAGTSGRLGALDAAECPPTFGVDYETVIALIAGGETAFFRAVEGAEDNREQGAVDLQKHGFCACDVLVGIAASGRTPYVIGAMDYAKTLGATVIALVCCKDSEMQQHADITIAPLPGPEVITGSTRMKSGTCQKMVLNMLSTAVMVKHGKVYGNLMADVKASNEKLMHRAVHIVCTATGETQETAKRTLAQCDYHCKTAIVMLLLNLDAQAAQDLLQKADGHIAAALRIFNGGDA